MKQEKSMTTEQRKALEKATIWQCRKDGMSYKQARGLARKAIRAYEAYEKERTR